MLRACRAVPVILAASACASQRPLAWVEARDACARAVDTTGWQSLPRASIRLRVIAPSSFHRDSGAAAALLTFHGGTLWSDGTRHLDITPEQLTSPRALPLAAEWRVQTPGGPHLPGWIAHVEAAHADTEYIVTAWFIAPNRDDAVTIVGTSPIAQDSAVFLGIVCAARPVA